ncbi:MAG: hypothetical protein EBV79_12905, partial [Betaproteobacteria bacterium]|nr:hypothetical protein [Betaproteobacteria bacterium]
RIEQRVAHFLDQVQATPARGITGADTLLAWDDEAQDALRDWVQQQPVLVQISAAKTLRDRAEQLARRDGAQSVTLDRIRQALGQGSAAAPSRVRKNTAPEVTA